MASRSRRKAPPARRAPPPALSPAELRSVLLEHRLGVGVRTTADVCAKYGFTASAFKRLGAGMPSPTASLRELVLACMPAGEEHATTIDSLQRFLDYRDHAFYPESELLPILDELVALGLVVRSERGWRLAGDAPLTARRFLFAPLAPARP